MGIYMETADLTLGFGRAGYRQQGYTMGTPREVYPHTIVVKSRETEFGVIEPVPTLKTYLPHAINGCGYPTNGVISCLKPVEIEGPSKTVDASPEKTEDVSKLTRAPPKKKWIREYLEEEPVSLRVSVAPPAPAPAAGLPPAPAPAPAPAPLDFAQEHSRARTTSANSHGPAQIPSPPSVGSSGSSSSGAPRAGTREVHNKLEKNRRAHLKECFELLKRQLPATPDDKKTSNLSILGSAIRYIQVLRRKERECEHEMERLAREKIAAQQRLAALKRDVTARPRATAAPVCAPDSVADDKVADERVNGQVLGISNSSPPRSPQSLNLSTRLRLPVQITTASQPVIRSSYGARHNTLTLTALAPAEPAPPNGVVENGVTNTISTLVHPAQIHLPISQVVSSGGVVVTPATLQLLSTGAGLRLLPAHANGVTTGENNRVPRTENGIVTPTVASTEGSVVRGLPPLVVSQPHLLHTHTLTHKMVESQLVKGSVSPLTVSAQYLSTTIVKPVVVVSSAHT